MAKTMGVDMRRRGGYNLSMAIAQHAISARPTTIFNRKNRMTGRVEPWEIITNNTLTQRMTVQGVGDTNSGRRLTLHYPAGTVLHCIFRPFTHKTREG